MEKLREAELEMKMEVSICEAEQGEVLSDDEELKTETLSEAKGSHGFKSDNLCMFAGERQLADIVMKKAKDQQNQNSILEEHEIDRSHIQLEKMIMEDQRNATEKR